MGFAAKLAAAQNQPSSWGGGAAGGPPPQSAPQGQYGAPPPQYGAPPPQYGAPPPQYGAPPPAGQYGAAPPQYGAPLPGQYGAPPPGQYGAPPPGQYGAPPPGQYGAAPAQHAPPSQKQPGFDVNTVRNKLESMVNANGLQPFYPPPKLHALADEVARKDIAGLARRWRLPENVAQDLITLALYDIIIFADDSGSMAFAEKGERIEDLKALLTRIADAATLFDNDGISVRFMNGAIEGNNLASAADVERVMSQIKFGGMTPLGTQLERKVLKPLVVGPAKTGQLKKPVLVITITDGEPTQESPDALRTAIKDAKKRLTETRFGAGAVAFQFAQVGKDEDAVKFLGKLDTDSKVGAMIDCTSYIELEQMEFQKKGLDLTPELYLVKLLCGAIDASYDQKDEVKKEKKKSLLKGLFS